MSRANLTSAHATRFCTCFVDAALQKVPAETLAAEMEGGSHDLFKNSLRSACEQCGKSTGG